MIESQHTLQHVKPLSSPQDRAIRSAYAISNTLQYMGLRWVMNGSRLLMLSTTIHYNNCDNTGVVRTIGTDIWADIHGE